MKDFPQLQCHAVAGNAGDLGGSSPPEPIENRDRIPGLKIIASLAPGAVSLRKILKNHPSTTQATLLIGPEGDFSPTESGAALKAGFIPISLGNIVLRVETATFFGLSALRYEFGDA